MTIQEAIKSGKRFRRNGGKFHPVSNYDQFTTQEVLADDWEIEREPREIFLIADKEDHLKSQWFNYENNAKEFYPNLKPIKFREVIE